MKRWRPPSSAPAGSARAAGDAAKLGGDLLAGHHHRGGRVEGPSNTLAIAQRELKSYFVSQVAYVVTAFFLLIAGYLFSVILLQSNEATLRFLISNLSVIWLFITPFLTMRLLAEEQRTGTIELLLTNPVREFELVIGKYLGAILFLFFMLLPTLYYPALLYMLGGQPDSGPMAAGSSA